MNFYQIRTHILSQHHTSHPHTVSLLTTEHATHTHQPQTAVVYNNGGLKRDGTHSSIILILPPVLQWRPRNPTQASIMSHRSLQESRLGIVADTCKAPTVQA